MQRIVRLALRSTMRLANSSGGSKITLMVYRCHTSSRPLNMILTRIRTHPGVCVCGIMQDYRIQHITTRNTQHTAHSTHHHFGSARIRAQ